MAAVCETEAYRERLALNPGNRAKLMAMDPAEYIRVMSRWLDSFMSGPDSPVRGVPEAELRAYRLPVIVVPGNDKTHSSVNGRAAASLIPDAQLYELPVQDQDVDLIPFPDWKDHVPALAREFGSFMRRHCEAESAKASLRQTFAEMAKEQAAGSDDWSDMEGTRADGLDKLKW